jgi:hypothetical protein
MKRKSLDDDDVDDDGSVDDWSDKGILRRRHKGKSQSVEDDWSDDEDEDDELDKRATKVKHPFEAAVDRIARERGIPKYLAAAHARKENPGSFRHYQQQGAVSSRPRIRKSAPPDDTALVWQSAVDALVASGETRTQAMTHIRKVMPKLWEKFRR